MAACIALPAVSQQVCHAVFSLWPTWDFQNYWDWSLDTSPERKCNEAYVDALGMVPNAPEFHLLYQDLPLWAKAGSKSAKLTTKSTHMMQ